MGSRISKTIKEKTLSNRGSTRKANNVYRNRFRIMFTGIKGISFSMLNIYYVNDSYGMNNHINVYTISMFDYNTGKTNVVRNTHEKLYQCKECCKSFSQRGDLKRHIMIHTSEKPYKCEICDMSFTQKGNLMTHKRTHTGV